MPSPNSPLGQVQSDLQLMDNRLSVVISVSSKQPQAHSSRASNTNEEMG